MEKYILGILTDHQFTTETHRNADAPGGPETGRKCSCGHEVWIKDSAVTGGEIATSPGLRAGMAQHQTDQLLGTYPL